MASLRCVGGPGSGKTYAIKDKCIFGRTLECDVYIADLSVSRRHAWIFADGNQHLIEDLGSANGTYVNEVSVRREMLQANDLIRIGGSSFYFIPGEGAALNVLTLAGLDLTAEVVRQATVGALADNDPATAHEEGVLAAGRSEKLLASMFAVADLIASELQLDGLLDKILSHLLDVFPTADRAIAFIVDRQTGNIVPQAVKQRGKGRGGLEVTLTGLQDLLQHGEAVVVDGSEESRPTLHLPRAAGRHAPPPRPKGHSMAVPLICRGDSLGALYVLASAGSPPFAAEDVAVLWAIARQAAVAITNAQASLAVLDRQRLEADLELARKIQRSFLPQRLAPIPRLDFNTHYSPARRIGGDFYDLIRLGPDRVAVLIGDVSGKGVSAALVMAKLASELRIFARTHESPSQVLTEVNRSMAETATDGVFATALYMLIDLDERVMTFANAGHQPPLGFSLNSGVNELDEPTSIALGVVPGTEYPEKSYRFSHGEVIVLYTDGINEALNFQQEPYGMERLLAAISHGPAVPWMAVDRVIGDLHRFVGSAPQSDDQTLLALALAGPPDVKTYVDY